MLFTSIGDGIWTAGLPLVVFGFGIGTRTTVVRLADGGLLVHSPAPLSDDLRAEVDGFGEVREIVAPNRFHHMYVREWKEAYPAARVHAAPGLQAKRKNFRFDAELGDAADPAWSSVLDQHHVKGAPTIGEVVFFHAASRTLLVTDLAMHFQAVDDARTRLFAWAGGVSRRFGPSRVEKLLVRDARAFGGSLERVLSWDFDRVLIAHGEPLDSGGKAAMRSAFAHVLGAK